jgi:hypothetical protein
MQREAFQEGLQAAKAETKGPAAAEQEVAAA